MNYRAVAKRLLQEHPQTISVALARLESTHASEVMKLLPGFIQADLMNRIVNIDQLPSEVIEEVDTLLNETMIR